MTSSQIAILTEDRYEVIDPNDGYMRNIRDEDILLSSALERHGFVTSRVSWSRGNFDWRSPRAAVFRSTWDYFMRYGEFCAWLTAAANQTQLINSAEIVKWNADKRYLLDLQKSGVTTTETVYVDQGASESLCTLMAMHRWNEVVVKPAISGGAWNTFRTNLGDAPSREVEFEQLTNQSSMLVQPFQCLIMDEGEISLMVIGGKYTHSVRKIAKEGDYRVQDDWGGTVLPYKPLPAEIEFAERTVAACPESPAYARVDVVRNNSGELALMELELIEPELFFRFYPPAADALAAVIADIL